MARKTLIHATNINGLGACQVVKYLIIALANKLENESLDIFLSPKINLLLDSELMDFSISIFKRFLPNNISRFNECLFSSLYFPEVDRALILGDLPLNGIKNQVVLVHQPNLIIPKINPYSSNKMGYKISRYLFQKNLPFVKYIVVQTGAMAEQLVASYPQLKNQIEIIPHPAPNWVNIAVNNPPKYPFITLFYPANNYPHKNFYLLELMNSYIKELNFHFKMIITLNKDELSETLSQATWLECVGRLAPEQTLQKYHEVTGLFFPSLLESYGLPLVESMNIGLPILCSDLPYARWLCEDQAIYFDPLSGQSACQSIQELHTRLNHQWQVNWEKPLAKIDQDWDTVAEKFINLLYS